MLSFCKLTLFWGQFVLAVLWMSIREDMFWPPHPYVLSLYKKRGEENDFQSFITLCFREQRLSASQAN